MENVALKPMREAPESPQIYFMQDTTVNMDFLRPTTFSENKNKVPRKPIEVEDEFPQDTSVNMDFLKQSIFEKKPTSSYVRKYEVLRKAIEVEDEVFSWFNFPDEYPDVPYVDVDYVYGVMDKSMMEEARKPIYVPLPSVPKEEDSKALVSEEGYVPEKVSEIEDRIESFEESQLARVPIQEPRSFRWNHSRKILNFWDN